MGKNEKASETSELKREGRKRKRREEDEEMRRMKEKMVEMEKTLKAALDEIANQKQSVPRKRVRTAKYGASRTKTGGLVSAVLAVTPYTYFGSSSFLAETIPNQIPDQKVRIRVAEMSWKHQKHRPKNSWVRTRKIKKRRNW
ncbi:uncharacterized protein LOC100678277 isoform X2 [Nasonia vitripennis]|uniref:Uncharacterized protein n=1 Tax=Nasonia vitripennis TaxID=7425 RepID=A0A7M7GCR2_NASVI|nr:uncharacterized protein LOC100678277 isoform X2 [Nasonia vitripennis]